jgi:hypothetical protein
MLGLAAAAFIVSGAAMLLLCQQDPKRLRAAGSKAKGMTAARRRALVAVTCLPGLGCAILGNSGAFVIWLGGCALFGWLLATYHSAGSTQQTPR